MKDILEQIDELVAECERIASELQLLAPFHYLTGFDLTEMDEVEREEAVRRFFVNFGPEDMDRTKITNEDSLIAFGNFKLALEKALANQLANLCIGLARRGLYKPHQ